MSDLTPSPVRDYPGDPFVSLILPCFNEEHFIENCLNSILEGDYPLHRLEFLVVDGMSTDATRSILQRMAEQHPCLRIIDNVRRIKPVALNLGIEEAKGDVLVRLDAHAEFPADYLTKLVRYLLTYDVVNVGGVRENLPSAQTITARVLARLLTHWFGVGDAKHYTGVDAPSYTDIVFLFCARRELFDEMGPFKEPLIRGQDREFNLRVSAANKRMLLVPDVRSRYFARGKIKGFFNWAFQGGATPFRINKYTDVNTVSPRNLVPAMFVLGIVFSLLVAMVSPFGGLTMLGLGLIPYFVISIYSSIQIAMVEKDLRFALLMPIAFFSWHVCYGFGSLTAAVEDILHRVSGRTQ